MTALLRIEWFKLWRQRRTWYALAALFVLEGVIMASAWSQGKALIDLLLENLQERFVFEGELLNGNLLLYVLLNSLWFNLPLILMIVVSGMLTDEYKDRTVQGVLLQAVRKRDLILAKYGVATGFTLLTVGLMAGSSAALSWLLFGTGDLIVYLDTLNFFPHREAVARIASSFALGAVIMVFYSTVSLTLAVWLRESAPTWIVAALFLILSNLLLKVDFGWEPINRYFFAKLVDTWQYCFYYRVDGMAIARNVFLLIVYTLLAAWIGLRTFQKRDLP